MTVHRFYVPQAGRRDGNAALSEDQSRQISRVLRLKAGDTICVFDGLGREFDAVLVGGDSRHWQFEVGDARWPDREPALNLTVGLSVLRNERFDLAVQKLVEVGVFAIVPLLAERSVIPYGDARIWEKRRARLGRIIVEASEQSERTTLPVLHNPQTVSQFLNQFDAKDESSEMLALVERQSTNELGDVELSASSAALLVGPEGGWSDAERTEISQRATGVSLGKLVLRAETAAIVGASYLVLQAKGGTYD